MIILCSCHNGPTSPRFCFNRKAPLALDPCTASNTMRSNVRNGQHSLGDTRAGRETFSSSAGLSLKRVIERGEVEKLAKKAPVRAGSTVKAVAVEPHPFAPPQETFLSWRTKLKLGTLGLLAATSNRA